LEKLSVIEILKNWCENKNVLEVLGQYKMFDNIAKEALDSRDDLYLKRDLLVISL